VWATLVLAGVEKLRVVDGLLDASDLDLYYMPWSHSLTAALTWSALAYAVVRTAAPPAWRTSRAAAVVAAAVLSHWVLDLVVHRADLPLYGDEAKVGLELWSSAPATFALEVAILAGGLFLYLRATRATSTAGRWTPWLLAFVLLGSGVSTVFGSASGAEATAATALAAYLLLAAAAWGAELRRRPT
jgi:hypothetical protein